MLQYETIARGTMNAQEVLQHIIINTEFDSDQRISDEIESAGYSLSRVQVYRIRTGKTEQPQRSSLRAIANTFGYDIKKVDGEYHFLKSDKINDSASAHYKPDNAEQVPPADTSKPPIPIIALGKAGEKGVVQEQIQGLPLDYDEKEALDYWEGDSDHWLTRPVDVNDIQAYGVRVEGDSMEPLLPEGKLVIASPVKDPASGDLAVVKVSGNSTYIKKVMFQGNIVLLKSFNASYEDKILNREDIEFIHKIVWVRL